ncbi:uncharacterized protein BDV14DRAFT_174618 [Aspergillus stella-maris]|uniref:uncharacterized protein n=1 Tax=Aspergillus stella-maris TaxID=1810926 RepID=UPI003CCD8EBF
MTGPLCPLSGAGAVWQVWSMRIQGRMYEVQTEVGVCTVRRMRGSSLIKCCHWMATSESNSRRDCKCEQKGKVKPCSP